MNVSISDACVTVLRRGYKTVSWHNVTNAYRVTTFLKANHLSIYVYSYFLYTLVKNLQGIAKTPCIRSDFVFFLYIFNINFLAFKDSKH